MEWEIVTERLMLVPLSLDQARAILAGDRCGRAWSPGYPTDGDVGQSRLLAEHTATDDPSAAWGVRQVVLRAGGEVVGGIGFKGPPDGDGTVEVGYGVAAEVRGQGLTSEALRGMLAAARADPLVRRVVGDADLDNPASRRVMEKAGMTLVGRDDTLVHYAVEVN